MTAGLLSCRPPGSASGVIVWPSLRVASTSVASCSTSGPDRRRGPRGASRHADLESGAVTPELQATLAALPDRPGVYLLKDARGSVLYVGKAQSLRSRVRSYWQKESASRPSLQVVRSVV